MVKRIHAHESVPKYYGIAYEIYSHNIGVCYPLGIHLMVMLAMNCWNWLRYPTIAGRITLASPELELIRRATAYEEVLRKIAGEIPPKVTHFSEEQEVAIYIHMARQALGRRRFP